jgi:hypothetical protein
MNAAPPATSERPLPLIAAAGLMVAATLAIYGPALHVNFLGDDFMILHRLRGPHHLADVLRFFRGEFFEYYRPLGFVSHAADWAIAGQNPRQFHFTNVLIHIINTLLVLLIGRALSPRALTGPMAAALFALHASNNEAVVWMSARFDLLATCFALAAVGWMVRGWTGSPWVPALLFFCALLSKESAVAMPIAAAAWSTFRLRGSAGTTLARVAPWLIALVAYSALRQLGGGVSAVGGSSRIPKLLAFGTCLIAMVLMAGERWEQLRDWLRPRRWRAAVIFLAVLGATTLAAALIQGSIATLAREKLTVAGFATFYLFSPVLGPGDAVFNGPSEALPWIVGAVALVVVAAIVFWLWDTLLDDSRFWFLGAFLAATLLPISALTEGKRYLYLPSAAMSLIVTIVVVELHGRSRRIALSIVAGVLAVSAVQIVVRVQDWRWAGRMTAEGAQLVDSTLAPACGSGHVVFLTSPVGMRGVYSHFYYETFEVPRGCMPGVFQIVVRVVRVDTPIEVRWDGPNQVIITAQDYRENFLLSPDLRAFDTPLRVGGPVNIQTPLGAVTADASDHVARVTLRLSADAQPESIHFFYYAEGRIQALRRPQ